MVGTENTPFTPQAPALGETDLRQRIDEALDAYTRFSDDCPNKLGEAIRHSLLGPGKRLRPRLVLKASEACGGSLEAAIPAACAVEMIHAYSLIHDDLPAMDDDDLRRGRPSCHRAFDEATAILAGDALQALAFQVMAEGIRPRETAALCCAALARAAGPEALVGGQVADLDEPCSAGNIDRLAAIHRRKTGAMFDVSMQLGGLIAGADKETLAALETYGNKFGLAFQITDDLLDVAGNEAKVGKRLGKDDGQGKLTFPGLLGVEESRSTCQRLIDEACEALAPLGSPADGLIALARSVPERDR